MFINMCYMYFSFPCMTAYLTSLYLTPSIGTIQQWQTKVHWSQCSTGHVFKYPKWNLSLRLRLVFQVIILPRSRTEFGPSSFSKKHRMCVCKCIPITVLTFCYSWFDYRLLVTVCENAFVLLLDLFLRGHTFSCYTTLSDLESWVFIMTVMEPMTFKKWLPPEGFNLSEWCHWCPLKPVCRYTCPTVTSAPLLDAMVAPKNSLRMPSERQRSEVRYDMSVGYTSYNSAFLTVPSLKTL